MSSTTMEPPLLSRPFSDLLRGTLRLLFLPAELGDESVAKITTRLDDDPWLTRLTALVQPVQEAPNHRSLRQVLARIGLSPALVSFDAELGALADLNLDMFDEMPPTPPFATARLGAEATALLIEALRLQQPAIQAQLQDGSLEQYQSALRTLGPEEIASIRHRLVLGDLLPPSAAEVLLTALRGQVALLALLQAALDVRKTAEWRAVALGEMAVEGAKALQRLALPGANHVDLKAALQEHEQRTARLFAQLEADAAKAEAP